MLLLSSVVFLFSKLNLKKMEHYQSVKQFGSRSGQTFCLCPDLGPNCLQRLSADDIFTPARKEFRGG